MTYRPDELGYTRDDRLYRLLTRFQREVDAARGQPLRALTRVVAEGLNLIEDDIERLLDNAFIETCEPWAVPYVAAIVGFAAADDAADESDLSPSQREALIRALAPRRLAANTIRHRRRKGTLRVLEDLAWDLAGWIARATEQGAGVLRAAHVQHVADGRSRLADLRDAGTLDRLDGPFSATARLFDAQPDAGAAVGGVTLFVWRTRVHRLQRAPARLLREDDACSDGDTYAYTFSPLGDDVPLFQNPLPSRDPTGIATDLEVPAAIRPLPFRLHPADYYGEGLSLAVYRPAAAGAAGGPYELIPAGSVVPADLGPGAMPVALEPGELAIDPARGRMLWKPATEPADEADLRLWTTHHLGAPDDVGGGYPIDPGEPPAIALPDGEAPAMVVRASVRRVEPADPDDPTAPAFRTINEAIADVGHRLDAAPPGAVGVIEVGDDEVYHEDFHARVAPGRSLIVRARAGRRPVVWPREHPDHRPHVEGVGGGRIAFEGIWFARGRLSVRGEFDLLSFRHSTFVPGGTGERGHGPSIELDEFRGALDVRRCVLGPVVVRHERRGAAPPRLGFSDSAIDGGTDPSACEVIHGGGRHAVAYARASFDRCTVVGTARVHALDHAEDSIFTGPLIVARRQRGQLGWCHVPRGSQTPARVRCQPDMEIASARSAFDVEAGQVLAASVGVAALGTSLALAGQRREVEEAAARRVEPRFLSTRFGDADYLVLPDDAPAALLRGAVDGSEMGVHHDLFFAPRAAALADLAEEYTPAGYSVEILFVHGHP